jgi:hypothetical protein
MGTQEKQGSGQSEEPSMAEHKYKHGSITAWTKNPKYAIEILNGVTGLNFTEEGFKHIELVPDPEEPNIVSFRTEGALAIFIEHRGPWYPNVALVIAKFMHTALNAYFGARTDEDFIAKTYKPEPMKMPLFVPVFFYAGEERLSEDQMDVTFGAHYADVPEEVTKNSAMKTSHFDFRVNMIDLLAPPGQEFLQYLTARINAIQASA